MPKLVKGLPHAALALFAGAIGLHPIHESDPHWHMMLGRAVLRYGSRVVPEPTALVGFAPTCVVPEWLWAVTTHFVHENVGAVGLSLLAALLAALCAFLIAGLCRSIARQNFVGAAWWVAVLVTCAAFQRLRLRPQAAFLCLLPLFLWLTRSYLHSNPAKRRWLGVGIAFTALIWAQLHGSFVLAPVIFLIQTVPTERPRLKAYIRDSGWLALLVFGALVTGAHGVHIVDYISAHASGDASHYVGDLVGPDWATLNPFSAPSVAAFWLLWLLSAVGIVVQRKLPTRELMLALVGALLLSTAHRFLSGAAILTAPLAVYGVTAIVAHLRPFPATTATASLTAMVAGIGLLVWTASAVDSQFGPVGGTGFANGVFPYHGAEFLRSMPEGSPVFTDYGASGPIGFQLDGHVRTYVDGRTPLYFDSTDFAVEREALQHADALLRHVQRYDFQAAVVQRGTEACASLQEAGWALAALDPDYSTFVRYPSSQVLQGFRGCGRDFVEHECPNPEGVERGIRQLVDQGEDSFTIFLQAERMLECDGEPAEALALLMGIRPEGAAYQRAHEYRLTQAMIELGQLDNAERHLARMANDGDVGVITLLRSPGIAAMSPARLRRILEALERELRDQLPPPVRSELARLCAIADDVECARFHSFRAAARGQAAVAPVLGWVAQRHPQEHVRRAAEEWIRTLRSEER